MLFENAYFYISILALFCTSFAENFCTNNDNHYLISQKVDHFEYINNSTFMQLYRICLKIKFTNLVCFNKLLFKQIFYIYKNFAENRSDPKGILFYAGNEAGVLEFCNSARILEFFAKKHNLAVLFVEHRYYGVSIPKLVNW